MPHHQRAHFALGERISMIPPPGKFASFSTAINQAVIYSQTYSPHKPMLSISTGKGCLALWQQAFLESVGRRCKTIWSAKGAQYYIYMETPHIQPTIRQKEKHILVPHSHWGRYDHIDPL